MLTTPIPSTGAKLHLSAGCDLEKVRPMTRAVRDFLAEEGATDEEAAACELALVEACNNAVLYSTPEGRQHLVEVEASCTPCEIEMRVCDSTPGFSLPEKINLPVDETESGRGLFIMHSVMDDLRYYRGKSQNTLVLRKFRSLRNLGDKPALNESQIDLQNRLLENEQIITDMTHELSSCYESLSAIFRAGSDFGKSNNIKEIAATLCKDLLEITACDWFLLRVVPRDESQLVVLASSPTHLVYEPLTVGVSSDSSLPVEAQAAVCSRDIWFNRNNPLQPGDPLQVVAGDGFGLVHPFFFCETLTGTLTVGKNASRSPFTSPQTNVVHTFAEFLAIQISNARMREDHVNNRLVAHELDIARNIQRALLPKSLPQLEGIRLAGFCESAREVGGDFYDVIPINDHSLMLAIADVMGKGIPAAMFAAILRSFLRASPELSHQPATLLARVNRLLYPELSEVDMFITAQVIFIDMKKRQLVAACAGHCPALLFSPGMSESKLISPEGLPLGILPEVTFFDEVQELLPQSRLLLYTDGLTETRNKKGEFFGDARLRQWFQAHGSARAEGIKQSLADELTQFRSHASLHDDQTFLVLSEEEKE